MNYKYLEGTQIVIGLKPPTKDDLLFFVGNIPRKHQQGIKQTDDVIKYIDTFLPWLTIPSTLRFTNLYNQVFHLYSNNKIVFEWDIQRINDILTNPPCPFKTILNDVYINPIYAQNTRGCSIRAIAAVRNYIISQDILDLDVVPSYESEAVFLELEKESLFIKKGFYWIPTQLNTKQKITPSMYPSFLSYDRNPEQNDAHFIGPMVVKVDSIVNNNTNCMFIGPVNEQLGDIKVERYLTNETKRKLSFTSTIYFVTEGWQEELLWYEMKHWYYKNMTRMQGYMTEMGLKKNHTVYCIHKEKLI